MYRFIGIFGKFKNILNATFVGLLFFAGNYSLASDADCNRSREVVIELENQIGKYCAYFTTYDLLSIESIDLINLNIMQLKDGDFSGLLNLRSLDLSENNLRTLPENLLIGLYNLDSIWLSQNRIEFLPEKLFTDQYKLDYLDLDNNLLETLPENLFLSPTHLTKITIANNRLTMLPKKIVKSLTLLNSLWLEGNKLTDLPLSIFYSDIGFLSLDSNLVNNSLAGMSKLDSLDIYHVNQSNLPAKLSMYLPNLKYLFIRGDTLSDLITFPDGYLDGFSNLEELYITDFALLNLKSEYFRDLKTLKVFCIARSGLENIPDDLFRGFTRITTIWLHSNRLTQLPSRLFTDVSLDNLDMLYISDNQFDEAEMKRIRQSLPNGVDIYF